MKTTLLAIAMMVTVNLSYAGETKLTTNLKKTFNKVMDFPKATTQDEGIVYVSFTIDEAGKAQMEQMNASHPDFATHVADRLETIELPEGSYEAGESHIYKFKFRKEK